MDTIVSLIVYAVIVYWLSMICRKAGFNPLVGFLAFIPLLNLIVLYYVAFARWPRFED